MENDASEAAVIVVIDDSDDDDDALSAAQRDALGLFRSIVPQSSYEEAVSFLSAANWNVKRALDQVFLHSSSNVASAPQVSHSKESVIAKLDPTDAKESVENNHNLSEQWHVCVNSTQQAKADHFVDPDFPPTASSLDGRARAASSDATTLCFCGWPATPKQVQSEGPNYGRFYLTCARTARSFRQRAEEKTEANKTTNPEPLNPMCETESGAVEANTAAASSSLLRNPYKKQKQAVASPSKTETNPTAEAKHAMEDGKNAGVSREAPCSFFHWDTTGVLGTINASSSNGSSGYGGTIRNLSWCHFGLERNCVLYRKQIHVSQIRQGTVGDCWFLSALAVVAEKPYLIERILPHTTLNTTGCYQINLFLDGKWQPILVDSYLPVVFKPRDNGKSHASSVSRSRAPDGIPVHITSTKGSNDGTEQDMGSLRSKGTSMEYFAVPAFCATPDRQLWPALIEKAYAKAHGSYQHLSGGYIAEGLQDLTGAPTETYVFQEMALDLDAFWVKLLSFHSAGFLIGVATYSGGDGLVGGHAYSVLDILDIPDSIVGEQSKLTDYFSSNPTETGDMERNAETDCIIQDDRKTLRLVRIRNPWGKREWKGDWSADSERWTRALRKRLGRDTTFAKGDGTFYMSFDDLLQRFHHMDVAKTQKGWVHISANGRFVNGLDPWLSSPSIFEISATKTTQAYISVIQPKKRSNTRTKYWYCDTSLILLRATDDCAGLYECIACSLNGVARQSHMDVFLEPGFKYYLMAWSCILSSLHSSNRTGDYCRPFSISAYSAAAVAMAPISDVENGGDSLVTTPTEQRIRQSALRALFSEIIPYNDGSLVFPIVDSNGKCGLLMGIHGADQGSCYFLALNGSSNHILSLRISIASGVDTDGLWVFTALNRNGQSAASLWENQPQDFDIPPLSQQIMFVVTSTGTSKRSKSLKTNPSFRYVSSWIATRQKGDSGSSKTYLGRNMELCPSAYNALGLHCVNTSSVCGSRGSIEVSMENSMRLLGAPN